MGFLTRKPGWKMLALAAAFAVWLNVASEPELEAIVSVPVQYNNFPKGLEISSNIVEHINVEARGSSGQLRSLSDAHTGAVIDFAGVREPGERTFTLTAAELNLPRGIVLIRTIPAQLRFTFERGVTRAVLVNVVYSGKLPPGLSLAQADVEPRQLMIAGPESRVLESKALVSDSFDLTTVTGDTERKLAVYATPPNRRYGF